MKTPLPFYKATATPHHSSLGTICIHHWAAIDRLDKIMKIADSTDSPGNNNALLVSDYCGNTVLHYAAASSSYSVAKYIVSLFPTNPFYNSNKISPAHIAAQRNDVKMLEIFRESSVLLKSYSRKNWSPFHFAIFYGCVESVHYLLEIGMSDIGQLLTGAESIDISTFSNNSFRYLSALDLAIMVNNADIIDLLYRFHALPSLHTAVRTNNLPAIGYHLFSPLAPTSKNIDLLSNHRNSTALHVAAAMGNFNVCHSLLERGSSTALLDSKGFSPLELAVISNSKETVKVLVSRSPPNQYAKAAFIAADLNHPDMIPELLNDKILASSVDVNGDSLLIRLIKRKMFELAEVLIKKNPDVNHRDANGATALHYAAVLGNKNTNLVNSLISLSQKDVKDNNGMTPLFYAVRSSSSSFNLFIENKCDIDSLNNLGLSPIVYAISLELNTKMLPTDLSLERKYDVNIGEFLDTHKIGKNIRMMPDYKQDAEMTVESAHIPLFGPQFLRALKSESPQLFIQKTGGIVKGGSLLHLAIIFEARSGIVKQFLEPKIPEWIELLNKIPERRKLLDRPDDQGRTPLMYATMLRRTNIMTMLIKLKPNVMECDSDGNTLYHYIDDMAAYDALKDILLNTNLSPSWPNNKGDLPLHVACRSGNLQMLKLFASMLEDPKDINRKNNNNETPLDVAFSNKRIECIEYLHSQGVLNLLVESVRSNDFLKLKEYIQSGYPINSYDKLHITALHAAADIESAEILKYLLDHGADPTIQTLKGFLPLHFAAMHNNLDICLLLLNDDIKISSIHSANQPFLMATDEKCKEFLFRYWKREALTKYLLKYIKRSFEIFLKIKCHINDLHTRYKINHKIFQSSLKTLTDILFVSERILSRRSSQPLPFSYKYSLHHLLMILTTVDLTSYCFELASPKLQTLFEEVKQYKLPQPRLIYQFLAPLFWINSIANLMKMLSSHLLVEIDNISLFLQVLTWVSHQQEEGQKYLPIGIPREEDSLFKDITENVIVMAEGRIDEIQKKPYCLFHPQFFDELKEFFSPKFTIPRTIPFRNRETIRIFVCDLYIVFVGRVSIKLPLFMMNFKLSKENEFTFTTPIGQFKFSIALDEPLLPHLKLTIKHRSALIHSFNHGESKLQKNKERIWECLVIYQLSGERTTRSSFMTIRAGTEGSCYDVCYAHLTDKLAVHPVFFNVKPRDITDNQNAVIYA